MFSRNSTIKVIIKLGNSNVFDLQTLENLEVQLYNHLMFYNQKVMFAVCYHSCKSENRKSHTQRYTTVQSPYSDHRGKPFANFISFIMTRIYYL